jgi:repressor LexA
LNFGSYLKQLIDKRSYSYRRLALLADIDHTYISKMVSGKMGPPSPEILQKLAKPLNVPYEELLVRAGYLQQQDKPSLPPGAFSNEESKPIPIYGEIRAGLPILVREDVEGYAYIDEKTARSGDYFFLRVTGDSMMGGKANIMPGSLVLVRRQDIIEDGQVGVVIIRDEEATLKRVYFRDGQYILTSENPAYKPQLYDAKDVRVIGEVIEVRHRLNGR